MDDGCLRLEHAVGAFTAACSQLVLELSRADEVTAPRDIAARIGTEMAATEKVLAAIGQTVVPDFSVVADRSDDAKPALRQ